MAVNSSLKLLGQYIKQLREAAKLSRAQLADMVGVSATVITMYEKGARQPEPRTFYKLAEALATDPYLLARKCGFDDEYIHLVGMWCVIQNAIPDLGYPISHERKVSALIDYGVYTLGREGNIPIARRYADRAISIIKESLQAGEANPSLKASLFRAYDLRLDVETRSGAIELREVVQVCYDMLKLVEDELFPLSNDPRLFAVVHFRFADVYAQLGRHTEALDSADKSLSYSKTAPSTRREALRVKLHAARELEDSSLQKEIISVAKKELEEIKGRDYHHSAGCLLQGLAMTLALQNQHTALEHIKQLEKWNSEARRRGHEDYLLNTLACTRRAQILAIPGPQYNLKEAKAAARRGVQLAGNNYLGIREICDMIVSRK